jgi:prepilin-type N-terminal cleavage/methylation domain-containing protein
VRYCHAESGFSLTEVMTAVVVFSLSLAGFSSMQIATIQLNARAHITTQMTTVAQEQMEELLSLSFTNTLTDPLLQDNDPDVGQGTTYCVWYPPEGLRPCNDPAFRTSSPSSSHRQYCNVTLQLPGLTTCTDALFPPPTIGYKVQWTVDVDDFGSADPNAAKLAYIDLTISKKTEGKQAGKMYKLSFARLNR